MWVKRILYNLMTANKQRRSPLAKLFLHDVKTYKKTGIRMREAILLSPEGNTIVQDGASFLTPNDIMKVRNILINGDECTDVLHLENLYYCVKELSDHTMILFNGANYIIACLTETNHLLIVNVKARRPDGARTVTWMQSMARDMKMDSAPQ